MKIIPSIAASREPSVCRIACYMLQQIQEPSVVSFLILTLHTITSRSGFPPREEQRMEASCVTTAPVFTLVTLARTRALAGEQTLGPLTQKQLLLF